MTLILALAAVAVVVALVSLHRDARRWAAIDSDEPDWLAEYHPMPSFAGRD